MSDDEKLAMVKDFFQMLQQLEEVKQKHAQQYPGFPPSIEGRELRPTPWRQSDELQDDRLRAPEPTKVEYHRYCYRRPTEGINELINLEPNCFKAPKTYFFNRLLIRERGVSYYAWSADGKTPIFPIPL